MGKIGEKYKKQLNIELGHKFDHMHKNIFLKYLKLINKEDDIKINPFNCPKLNSKS
jgi:hypothetical protein